MPTKQTKLGKIVAEAMNRINYTLYRRFKASLIQNYNSLSSKLNSLTIKKEAFLLALKNVNIFPSMVITELN